MHRRRSTRTFKLFLAGLLFALAVFAVAYSKFHSLFLRRERVTVAVASSPPAIVTINRQSGEVSFLFIPEDTYLDVPGGFGSNRIGKVWDLGAIEKRGGELFTFALQAFLGVPIDGWIGWEGNSRFTFPQNNSLDSIRSLSKEIIPLSISKHTSVTNMGLLDRWFLWNILRNIRGDKLVRVDLFSKGVLVKTVTPDGGNALVGDPELVDKVTQTIFFEKLAKDEPLSLQIQNATDKSGIGKKIARLLTNVGYQVSQIKNAPQEVEHCRIEAPKQALQRTSFTRLGEILGCQIQVRDIEMEPGTATVVIGKNMTSIW